MAVAKRRLGEILVQAGIIDETRLKAALAEQKKWGGRLGKVLVDLGFVDEETMVVALSRQLNLPSIDPTTASLPPDIGQALRLDLCERYGVMPIEVDRKRKILKIATSDPTNQESFKAIEAVTGLRVEPVVASMTKIEKAIRRIYYGQVTKVTALPEDLGIDEQQFEELPQAASVTPVTERKELPQLDLALMDNVEKLENMLAGEVRALRTLVEMLIDQGIIDRDEYVRRVRGK